MELSELPQVESPAMSGYDCKIFNENSPNFEFEQYK